MGESYRIRNPRANAVPVTEIQIPLAYDDDGIKKAAEYLIANQKIGSWTTQCDKHPRYINLRTQEMFDSLVNLYANLFITEWHRYTIYMESFPPPTGVSPHIHAARCYISMWFIDLYVSNRNAVRELSITAFVERYQGELCPVSFEYDDYLVLLHASIRPTQLKNFIDNSLYIPIIVDNPHVDNPNPFGIQNFTPDGQLVVFGLIQIMKAKNRCRFSPLSSDPMGRPCWLFDWHTEDRVCSWFSHEGNYDPEDVALAYILGTACTSNMGLGDRDDWQFFDDAIVPQNPNPMNYQRVEDRSFYGSYEVRTMEIDTDFSLRKFLEENGMRLTKKARKDGQLTFVIETDEPSGKVVGDEEGQEINNQPTPRFRVIDWVYYSRVILKMDDHLRTVVHRMISLK